jgi:hypothetical protein
MVGATRPGSGRMASHSFPIRTSLPRAAENGAKSWTPAHAGTIRSGLVTSPPGLARGPKPQSRNISEIGSVQSPERRFVDDGASRDG